jgi:GGDEF domain-containing protein
MLRIERAESFAVCYLDLDYFKPFADTFGFAIADEVIRGLGGAIRESSGMVGSEDGKDFVGHIGGDDFIILTAPGRAEAFVAECTSRAKRVIERAVGDEAAKQGSFTGVDREGQVRRFPLSAIVDRGLAGQARRMGEPAASRNACRGREAPRQAERAGYSSGRDRLTMVSGRAALLAAALLSALATTASAQRRPDIACDKPLDIEVRLAQVHRQQDAHLVFARARCRHHRINLLAPDVSHLRPEVLPRLTRSARRGLGTPRLPLSPDRVS